MFEKLFANFCSSNPSDPNVRTAEEGLAKFGYLSRRLPNSVCTAIRSAI